MDEANSYRYFRSSVVRALKPECFLNLDDKYYFAYSGLATFAVGYVVYAALVDPTGILSFDQQIVNFGENPSEHGDPDTRRRYCHRFLTRGTKYGYNDQEPVGGNISDRGNTMLTFMGTDLGDAEKVSDL
jgi:hypothetical protein